MSFFDIGKEVSLFYEIKGNLESDATIVFLNGVMASTNSWYHLYHFLKDLDTKCCCMTSKDN